MVKVRDDHPIGHDGDINISEWLTRLKSDDTLDIKIIGKVCNLAKSIAKDNKTNYQESAFEQGLIIAEILYSLRADVATICAGILYPAIKFSNSEVSSLKLDFVSGLKDPIINIIKIICNVDSIHEKTSIKGNKNLEFLPQTLSNLRNMLIELSSDIRAILIKLAQHLCDIRYAKNVDEELKRELALESINVFVPVANRLGIGQIKWELEDLSFRYLEPDIYKNIAKLLAEKRLEREKYIKQAIELLEDSIGEHKIDAKVYGRVKHIYSIWRKMQRKRVGYQEIYDVRAIRVLVPDVADCYAVLGLVHSLWEHIPKEFDDYIARPKSNGYQSLHTAVIGPESKVFEIQIRTFKMHQTSEIGNASHWRYKEGGVSSKSEEQKLASLRRSLNQDADESSMTTDLHSFKEEKSVVDKNKIFVFTPTGDVIELPEGATPLDFAYKIHTDVGNKCRGAKIDGKIVNLSSKIPSGSVVEVLTSKQAGPSRDWLNTHLGFVTTSRARLKIQHWFKERDKDQNIIDGRDIITKELKRIGIGSIKHQEMQELIQNFANCKTEDDLYAQISVGDIRISQVLGAISRIQGKIQKHIIKKSNKAVEKSSSTSRGINIGGVGNLVHHIARCCKPQVGDNIIGYVTISGGVSIHRTECQNVLDSKSKKQNRFIDVYWQNDDRKDIIARVIIKAFPRRGLLKDITSAFLEYDIDMQSIKSSSNPKENLVLFYIDLEVSSLEKLGLAFAKIQQISNVIDIYREIN